MDRARTHENNTHNNRRISGSALRRNPCNRRPTGGHRRTSSPPGSACTAGRRRSSRGLRHLPEKPSWSRLNLFEVRSVRRRHRHRAVRRISSALASMMSGVPPVGWCRSATIEDAGSQRGRYGVAHPFPSPPRHRNGAGPLLTSLGKRESPPIRRSGRPNPDRTWLLYSTGSPTVRDPNDVSAAYCISLGKGTSTTTFSTTQPGSASPCWSTTSGRSARCGDDAGRYRGAMAGQVITRSSTGTRPGTRAVRSMKRRA